MFGCQRMSRDVDIRYAARCLVIQSYRQYSPLKGNVVQCQRFCCLVNLIQEEQEKNWPAWPSLRPSVSNIPRRPNGRAGGGRYVWSLILSFIWKSLPGEGTGWYIGERRRILRCFSNSTFSAASTLTSCPSDLQGWKSVIIVFTQNSINVKKQLN